jgi:DUF4097 and DUF4098 domain-containing protein YvlB
MKRLIPFLVGGVLLAITSHAQDFEYSFKETYEVAKPAKLNLASFDGNLEIIPTDGNKITAYYIVKKGLKLMKIGRNELEQELIVETDQTKNSVLISVRRKNEDRVFSSENSINVHFKVYVPKETACLLKTSDGNISLSGLISDQDCKTSDGSISVANVSGNVRGKTSDGDVRIKDVKGLVDVATSDGNIVLSNITGDVQGSTSDGDVDLDRVKGDIVVKTSDGSIGFKEISGSFRASTSDGNIRGNVVELKSELTLKTSGGNIDVALPGQLGLDLDIKAESIDVPFKNFTGKFDKTYVRGQSNGGGIPVILSTSDGSVTLTY